MRSTSVLFAAGSGVIYTLPGSNNNAARGTIWLRHQDFSSNYTDWTRLEATPARARRRRRVRRHCLAPRRFADDAAARPAVRERPELSARAARVHGCASVPLGMAARRRPRGIEGAEWSAFEAAVPWACSLTVNPSGRFVRQIGFQWRPSLAWRRLSGTVRRSAERQSVDDAVSDRRGSGCVYRASTSSTFTAWGRLDLGRTADRTRHSRLRHRGRDRHVDAADSAESADEHLGRRQRAEHSGRVVDEPDDRALPDKVARHLALSVYEQRAQ